MSEINVTKLRERAASPFRPILLAEELTALLDAVEALRDLAYHIADDEPTAFLSAADRARKALAPFKWEA